MSHLYYLIGPPGSGKRTVGKELARLTGATLIDNHLINDPILTAWGSDGNANPPAEVWRLMGQVRAAVMRAVELSAPDKAHIFTNYLADNEQEWQTYHSIEGLALKREVSFVPVWLTCPVEELKHRMTDPERRERLKISNVVKLYQVLDEHGILPIPDGALTLNTAELSPTEAARAIVNHAGAVK